MTLAALVDLDGTLVDASYDHAIAWYRAFRQHGIVLLLWKLHRSVGMGGDQLVQALAGPEVENRSGDEIRAAEQHLYRGLIQETEPLAGAREFLAELKRRGHRVVLASSAPENQLLLPRQARRAGARGRLDDGGRRGGDEARTRSRSGAGAPRRRGGRRLRVARGAD